MSGHTVGLSRRAFVVATAATLGAGLLPASAGAAERRHPQARPLA